MRKREEDQYEEEVVQHNGLFRANIFFQDLYEKWVRTGFVRSIIAKLQQNYKYFAIEKIPCCSYTVTLARNQPIVHKCQITTYYYKTIHNNGDFSLNSAQKLICAYIHNYLYVFEYTSKVFAILISCGHKHILRFKNRKLQSVILGLSSSNSNQFTCTHLEENAHVLYRYHLWYQISYTHMVTLT